MREQALSYLDKSPLLNASMTEPIRRNMAEILAAEETGVLIRLLSEAIFMLSADSREKGMELLEQVQEPEMVVVHQKFLIEPVKKKYGFKRDNICDQAVYTGKTPLSVRPDADIRRLDMQYYEFLTEHYHLMESPEYMAELIELGVMHGIFENGQLAGFMGMHTEGSMGILEILPEYQRRGYGTELQKYMINFCLERGWTPFGQIIVGNKESLGLQKKLGMELAPGKVTWLY